MRKYALCNLLSEDLLREGIGKGIHDQAIKEVGVLFLCQPAEFSSHTIYMYALECISIGKNSSLVQSAWLPQ